MSTARCFSISSSFSLPQCCTFLSNFIKGCFPFSNRNEKNVVNLMTYDSPPTDIAADQDPFKTATLLVPSKVEDITLPLPARVEKPIDEDPIMIISKPVNDITLQGSEIDSSQNYHNFIPPVVINDSNTNAVIDIPSVGVHSNVQDLGDNNWNPIGDQGFSQNEITFQLPIPITNELKTQQPMISPILDHRSPLLYQEPIFEPIPLNSELTASVYVEGLECFRGDVSTISNSSSSLIHTRSSSWGPDASSPIQPNLYFSGHAMDPWGDEGAELEPSPNPISEYSSRIYNAFDEAGYNCLNSEVNNEGGERSGYRRTPSNKFFDLNLDDYREVAEVDEYRTQPRLMTDEEHRQYMKKESEEKKMAESGGDDFFGNLLKGLMENQTINPQQLFNAISSGDFGGLFPAKPPSPVMIPQLKEPRTSRRR
jgi:hypothetical protein